MSSDDSSHANDVYAQLYEFVKGTSLNVYYVRSSRDNHVFVLEGHLSDFDNPFQTLTRVCEDHPPTEIEFSGSVGGTHIKLHYNEDELIGEPDPQTTFDRIEPREPKTARITECSNCKASTHGLHRPPATLVYPSDNAYEDPRYETHDLCVTCSPGHFDDVTRGVEYFSVNKEETHINQIGFTNEEGETEWVPIEEMDNPFIQDTIEVLNNVVLNK